ncbi:hypothetical protein YC2023_083511 [Brassica napus]|uniref:(rape) hypothetical protein n=1 Tax=Brassica napus TaxID=3708 RepID=A0A816MBZ7_BRANA|nr:unnamed protein product [Brassica napus]
MVHGNLLVGCLCLILHDKIVHTPLVLLRPRCQHPSLVTSPGQQDCASYYQSGPLFGQIHLGHRSWKQCSGVPGLWYVYRVYNERFAMGI